MAIKRAILIHEEEKAAAAALLTVKSRVVPPDQIWCIQRYAYEGSAVTSGGNTRARAYRGGHGYNHYLSEKDGPSADALYCDPDPIWLHPGEQLCLEWDQASINTIIKLFAEGYWVPLAEGMADG